MNLEVFDIKYNGKVYPVAEIPDVFTHEEGHHLLIGSHSLNVALYNDKYGYPDERAMMIDERIYAFIDDEVFFMNEEEFVTNVKEKLD